MPCDASHGEACAQPFKNKCLSALLLILMRLIVPSNTVRWLTLLTVASVLTVGSFGGLSPWISPDTAGYFNLGGFSSSLAAPRTPVYGWLIDLLTLGTSSFAIVPSLHLSVFIGGVWLLAASLLRFGLSEIAVISLKRHTFVFQCGAAVDELGSSGIARDLVLALRNILRFHAGLREAAAGTVALSRRADRSGSSVPDAAELFSRSR